MTTTFSGSPMPDSATQRAILEPLLNKRWVEGDFWYTIVTEWLAQWKRHVGVTPPRKYYHTRSPPGPVLTMKDFGYSAELIHEDVWKVLVNWYGLAEGHKVTKHVIYNYNNRIEVEHNLNTFKLISSEAPNADPQTLRFSKMEKIGHVEWKAREVFNIDGRKVTRMWGKQLETDSHWRPLFRRDKPIGKVLELDSDFLRSSLYLEIQTEQEGVSMWRHRPSPIYRRAPAQQDRTCEGPIGTLCQKGIFEDLTSGWETDIHDQIDKIGKTLMKQLHNSFSGFVTRAKDYVDEKEASQREKEQHILHREERVRSGEAALEQKERGFEERQDNLIAREKEFEMQCEVKIKALNEQRENQELELETARWNLSQAREALEKDKVAFQQELMRMGELHEIQETRVKLDIGGHIFTTSKLTLTKDPHSMLAAMFSGRHPLKCEPDGSYFIDRDGTHFRYILNYLRDGGIKEGAIPQNENLWREFLTEAQFYQLEGLVDHLQGLFNTKTL